MPDRQHRQAQDVAGRPSAPLWCGQAGDHRLHDAVAAGGRAPRAGRRSTQHEHAEHQQRRQHADGEEVAGADPQREVTQSATKQRSKRRPRSPPRATSSTTAVSATRDAERDHLPTGLVTLFPEGPSGLLRPIGHGTTVGGRRRRRGAARRATAPRPRPAAEPPARLVGDREVAEPARRDQHPGLQAADRRVVVAHRGVERAADAGRGGRTGSPSRSWRSRPSRWISRAWSASASWRQPWATVRSSAIRVVGEASTTCRSAAYSIRSRSVVERDREARLGRHEEHHELGRLGQRPPVGLGAERVDVLPQLAGVAGTARRRGAAWSSVRGGVEVGVERHLGVDHHLPAADQVDDQVGAQRAVGHPQLLA